MPSSRVHAEASSTRSSGAAADTMVDKSDLSTIFFKLRLVIKYMKKILYIIPGWEDDCSDKQYQQLASAAKEKDYEVKFQNIDWKRPLSSQIFAVPPEATVFGFSLGALMARLVAQNYHCQHIILASMTPDYNFTDPEIKKALVDLAGIEFIDDLTKNLKLKHKANKQTLLYGSLEEEDGDILVPDTEHELNEQYIKEIAKIL